MSRGLRRPGRRAPVPAALGALLLAGLGAAGCVSPRNTLGTSSSACYRAVPVASEAVHDKGHLAGIRLVGAKELGRHASIRDELTARAGHVLAQVCVVSFHGDFRVGDVDKRIGRAPASGHGPVAVVVVSSPQNRLIGTYIVEREPLPLRHEV